MRIDTSFPGGVRVEAMVRGHVLATDQPTGYGGDDSAPSPFELYLGSIATCAAFYAAQFCRKRNLPTEGLAVSMEASKDPDTHQLAMIQIDVTVPDDFPEKYRTAIVRSIDQCAVKRSLEAPPRITTVVHEASELAIAS